MLGTLESELKCEILGSDCWADYTHWKCKLQTGGKITRKVDRWNIVNYTLLSFSNVMVHNSHGTESQPFAQN